jgi:excisionase family DNA binding protein
LDISQAEKLPLTEKLALTIPEVCELSGVCRSNIYVAISSGELRARKRGRSTLILRSDLNNWIEGLPDFAPCAPRGVALEHVERRRALAAAATPATPSKREAAADRARSVAQRQRRTLAAVE